jgi:hypothetical protein
LHAVCGTENLNEIFRNNFKKITRPNIVFQFSVSICDASNHFISFLLLMFLIFNW